MDGRQTEIEALGVHLTKDETGKDRARLRAIPTELYDRITEENEKEKKADKEENVIVRFELTEAEFKKPTRYMSYGTST